MKSLDNLGVRSYERTSVLLNRTQLAEALGISPRAVTMLTKEGCPVSYMGIVKQVKRGAHPRYDLEEVKRWLRDRTRRANA